MDPHVKTCEELFSAAKTEFKHLEYYYFHNMLYDYVWQNNHLRHNERLETWDLLHKYGPDYKVIIVGDASMSPYEITMPGGSVDYYNKEPGALWLKRLTDTYDKLIWLNPVQHDYWDYTSSVQMVQQLVGDRMYPLTLGGLEEAIGYLSR